MTVPAEQIRTLERSLQLAHQSRRACEHTLDGIRRALCDAGFMEDGDPYGHADLADVIRQAGEAREAAPMPATSQLCGDPGPGACDLTNPCSLPIGHDKHRDQDGCSWPAPEPVPLTRTAVRAVVKFMSGVHGGADDQYIERLTDDVWAKAGAAEPLDGDGSSVRARILKQARVHLRQWRRGLPSTDDHERGIQDGAGDASSVLTMLDRMSDAEFWAEPRPRGTVEVIGREGAAR